MRKLVCAITMFTFLMANAQEKSNSYGVTAGFNSLMMSGSAMGLSSSDSAQGYYVGFFAEFMLAEKFGIQPEILFASASPKEGDTVNEIVVPVMAKYYVSEEFAIQAGPMLDYVLEDTSSNFNKLGFGLAAGASYDFSDNLFTSARYSLGLNDRFDSDLLKIKHNFLQIGLGYRF